MYYMRWTKKDYPNIASKVDEHTKSSYIFASIYSDTSLQDPNYLMFEPPFLLPLAILGKLP